MVYQSLVGTDLVLVVILEFAWKSNVHPLNGGLAVVTTTRRADDNTAIHYCARRQHGNTLLCHGNTLLTTTRQHTTDDNTSTHYCAISLLFFRRFFSWKSQIFYLLPWIDSVSLSFNFFLSNLNLVCLTCIFYV